MPPELSQLPTSNADYWPIVYAILTMIILPVMRRLGVGAAILSFIRSLLEVSKQREKEKADKKSTSELPITNGREALRFSATLAESQGARLDTVEDTQRNNIKRLEAIEHWRDGALPRLEGAAKIGAFNAFSGKMNDLNQRMETVENRQELMLVELARLNEIDARLATIDAEIAALRKDAA